MTGKSPAFEAVLRSARLVAATDATVLILGESGTGKELLARQVHRESRRAGGPWVTVNCAALPCDLAEAELFGYRAGAFTGARGDRRGRAQQADGGTLFLDEIAELSLPTQGKLLRFLEYGECHPLGASRAECVDVRVVAATHQDLRARVAAGAFRADLFYRLHVIPLELPPLRERDRDVLLLMDSFTAELARRHGVEPPRFDAALRRRLAAHDWPGNVRELRNLVERCVVLLHGRHVGVDDLPADWLESAARCERESTTGRWRLPPEGVCLDTLEADLIRQALDLARGNRSRAARLLGISRDTLLYRIRKYAIA